MPLSRVPTRRRDPRAAGLTSGRGRTIPRAPPGCAASRPARARPRHGWRCRARIGDSDWPDALAVAARRSGGWAGARSSSSRTTATSTALDAALRRRLGKGQHVRLTADQGPQARYTAWLKVLRGHVRVVIGTRAAAFAPVHDLGLVAWWDDGDDLLAEPRAPYHHDRRRPRRCGPARRARPCSRGASAAACGWQADVEAGQARPGRGRPRRGPRCGAAGRRRWGGTRRGARRARRPGPPAVAGVARGQGRPASTGPCSSRSRGGVTCRR